MSVPAQAVPDEGDDELVDVSGLIGRTLADRYRVTGLLGAGGIGRVYLAEHLVLKRQVAIKVLLEHYQCVPDLQRRFEREAMALAALSHPNIVSITDFVTTKELTFLVMELVDGKDLDEILEERGPLPPEDAFEIMAQMLSSLAYAHGRDVIHRDLKPQNVLVRELPAGRKHAVILDFGLAKFMDGSGPSANLTKTGLVVGTPAYMAPEQASGAHADRRADVYAAGVMLYEMLSGELPFDGEGQEMLRQHLLKPPPPLAEKCPGARVAPELEAFLQRALAKDGADRFADGSAMLDALLALPIDAFVPGDEATTSNPTLRSVSRAPTAIAPAAPLPTIESPGAPKRGGGTRSFGIVIGALVLGAAILGSTWMYLRARPGGDPTGLTSAFDIDPETPDPEPVSAGAAEEEPEGEGDDAAGDEAGSADEEATSDEEANDEEATDEGDEEIDAEADEEPEPAAASDAPRPSARNPWRGRTPRELAIVRRRIARGRPLTRLHVRAITRYRRSNPRDPRGTLLLGQAYMARGQGGRALNQYLRAYRRDPSSRGDPRMRRDLVRLAGSAALHERATEALREVYGEEAIPTVNRAIRRERDDDDRARLEAALRQIQPAE